jgi:hypothetical protein
MLTAPRDSAAVGGYKIFRIVYCNSKYGNSMLHVFKRLLITVGESDGDIHLYRVVMVTCYVKQSLYRPCGFEEVEAP